MNHAGIRHFPACYINGIAACYGTCIARLAAGWEGETRSIQCRQQCHVTLKISLRLSIVCIWEIGCWYAATFGNLVGQGFSWLLCSITQRKIDLPRLSWRQVSNTDIAMRQQYIDIAERGGQCIGDGACQAIVVQAQVSNKAPLKLTILFQDDGMECPGAKSH